MASEARVILTCRVNRAGVEWAQDLADANNSGAMRVDRSDVIRAALAVARAHESEVIARLKVLKEQM